MSVKRLENTIKTMMKTGLFHDEAQAKMILIATLKSLRDRMPKVEAFHLSSYLPEDIRHDYMEGWKNGQRQAPSIIKSEFLAEVSEHLNISLDLSLDDLVPAAMSAILEMVRDDEAQKIRKILPLSMKTIFDNNQSMN